MIQQAFRTRWSHESGREELLEFLQDKPPVAAITATLVLNRSEDPESLELYQVNLSGTTLSDHILEALNCRYRDPEDIEGVLWFTDGTWAKHENGEWIYSKSQTSAPPQDPIRQIP